MDQELYEAILKALKADNKFKDVLRLFQVKDENEIEGVLGELKPGKVKFDEIVKDKDYQSDLDKLLAKAANTREEKLKEKYNFVKKDGEPDDKGGKGTTETDNAILKQLNELQEKVKGYEQGRVLEKKQAEAQRLMKDNKIPEKFMKLFDFESEESIEDQFKEIQGAVGEFKEKVKEEIGAHGPIPIPNAKVTGQASDKEIEAIIKDLN